MGGVGSLRLIVRLLELMVVGCLCVITTTWRRYVSQWQCAARRECRGVRLGPEPIRLWVLALQPPQCRQMARAVSLCPHAFAQGVPSSCACAESVHMPAQSVCVGDMGDSSRVR